MPNLAYEEEGSTDIVGFFRSLTRTGRKDLSVHDLVPLTEPTLDPRKVGFRVFPARLT
jgi:hypothetical protein